MASRLAPLLPLIPSPQRPVPPVEDSQKKMTPVIQAHVIKLLEPKL